MNIEPRFLGLMGTTIPRPNLGGTHTILYIQSPLFCPLSLSLAPSLLNVPSDALGRKERTVPSFLGFSCPCSTAFKQWRKLKHGRLIAVPGPLRDRTVR